MAQLDEILRCDNIGNELETVGERRPEAGTELPVMISGHHFRVRTKHIATDTQLVTTISVRNNNAIVADSVDSR